MVWADTFKIINLPLEEVNEKLTLLGLIINGKPLSFTGFKNRVDAHEYGRGRDKIYIIFVGHPKENLFAFYPPQTTKADSLIIAYDYYLDTVLTDIKQEYIEDNVMWGNKGYPIFYGSIGVY